MLRDRPRGPLSAHLLPFESSLAFLFSCVRVRVLDTTSYTAVSTGLVRETRSAAVRLSRLLSSCDPDSKLAVDAVQTDALLAELRNIDAGLDATLAQVVPLCVAFHHAGVCPLNRFICCCLCYSSRICTQCSGNFFISSFAMILCAT